ncbi:MAG: hypothetical protein A2340_06805 [Lentisphaerae bacterium RIFOXYB12_FULL_60_10]|nr:MAG: hypothetical protein A2340_06805 [Lentisphaerae bacterium RIFOXYB12_FULL_60_10]
MEKDRTLRSGPDVSRDDYFAAGAAGTAGAAGAAGAIAAFAGATGSAGFPWPHIPQPDNTTANAAIRLPISIRFIRCYLLWFRFVSRMGHTSITRMPMQINSCHKRRQGAQFPDDSRQVGKHVIDIGVGVVTAEAEPD